MAGRKTGGLEQNWGPVPSDPGLKPPLVAAGHKFYDYHLKKGRFIRGEKNTRKTNGRH